MSIISPCPVSTALSVIGGKWKPIILWVIRNESKRFGEILKTIPTITQKMLTQHLRELEKDGIIRRKVYPVVPPKVEYSLTTNGYTLKPVLDAIADWGAIYQTLQAKEHRSASPRRPRATKAAVGDSLED